MAFGVISGAASSGGRFIPQKPTIGYPAAVAGQFKLGTTGSPATAVPSNPYDANLTYNASGGTRSGDTVFVTSTAQTPAVISARSVKGVTDSASIAAYRQARTYTTTYYPYNQCGGQNCQNTVNPNMWQCGGACPDSGGGAWGYCVCRGPAFSTQAENSYSPSGFSFNGTTNEWWKVV